LKTPRSLGGDDAETEAGIEQGMVKRMNSCVWASSESESGHMLEKGSGSRPETSLAMPGVSDDREAL
jgi:hypothetical protein